MKRRLDYIDRMKGFAILLMVLGHVYLAPAHLCSRCHDRAS